MQLLKSLRIKSFLEEGFTHEQGMRLSNTVGICLGEFMGAQGELSDPCTVGTSIPIEETDLFTESNYYAGDENPRAPRSQRGNVSM